MTILITTARFTADGAQGGAVVARSEHMEAAARQLIAGIGGTLIGCYRTSGDHDLVLIFEAPSYEEAVAALDAAAAGSGVTDLTTVRVLTSNETKTSLPESPTVAAIHPSEGMNAAQRATAEPGAPPALPDAGTASDSEADAKAAARILEARKKSAEDIAAGRPAPYYFATPTTSAPSRPNPARASKDDDGSAKR
jgi:uncharacterized protein with GYD domain